MFGTSHHLPKEAGGLAALHVGEPYLHDLECPDVPRIQFCAAEEVVSDVQLGDGGLRYYYQHDLLHHDGPHDRLHKTAPRLNLRHPALHRHHLKLPL